MEKEKKKRTAIEEAGSQERGKDAGRRKKKDMGAAVETAVKAPETAVEAPEETVAEVAEIAPETAVEASEETVTETAVEVAEIAPETAVEAPEETATETAVEVAEIAPETAVETSTEPGSINVAGETMPAVAAEQKVMETPHMRMQREFRERTRVIREQMVNIQRSFVTIGFQLHWIKNHKMFKVMDYKNIYEYAEKEYGMSRASCSNLICIIENYADRDEHGNVIESIADCYKNYSSSQLVAMIGMPEDMKREVTPDMSVRAINRMRRGIPDKQAEAATDVPSGKASAQPESVSASATGQEKRDVQAEDSQMPGEPDARMEKTAATAAQPSAAEMTAGTAPVQEPAVAEEASGQESAASAAAEEPFRENQTQEAAVTVGQPPTAETAAAPLQEPVVKEVSGQEETVSVVTEPPAGSRKEKGDTAGTLFTFDSYSTYRKAREKVNDLIEKVFSRDTPVTVKIVYTEG